MSIHLKIFIVSVISFSPFFIYSKSTITVCQKDSGKFNSTFLRDKRFKDWLVAVPGKNTEGKCKLCASEI